ncbi:MAG: hypothetical protein AAF985_05750 [Bacteroidota bacterium]
MDRKIDEDFLGFSEFVEQLASVDGKVSGIEADEAISMEIETVKMGLPFQMDIAVAEDGTVALGGVPPLYYTETSFMPAFHQIEITLEKIAPEDQPIA